MTDGDEGPGPAKKSEVKSAATNGYVTPPSTLAIDSMVPSTDDAEVERTMNQAHVNGNILNGDGDHWLL